MKAPYFAALVATTAMAQSTLTITNLCPFEIFYQPSNSTGLGVSMALTPGAKAGFAVQGTGNALKFSYPDQNQAQTPIAFDFSVADFIYYDVSDVAGFPFALAACPSDIAAAVVGCPATLVLPGSGSGSQSLVCDATRTARVGSAFNIFACPQNFVGNVFKEGRPSVPAASTTATKPGMVKKRRNLADVGVVRGETSERLIVAKDVMEDMRQ